MNKLVGREALRKEMLEDERGGKMNDLISRGFLLKSIDNIGDSTLFWGRPFSTYKESLKEFVKGMPSEEQKDWMEQNKDRILQAGKEGREVEFQIDGRLFAIREKAQ